MQKPLIAKSSPECQPQRGVTILLVALAMVAIISMAALSIDVITLYLAKEEAQRSANEAALAAARILSLSGITGDPTNATGNWNLICGPDDGTHGLAGRAAKAVVNQNPIGNVPATTVSVTYAAGINGTMGAGTSDCTSLSAPGSAFGVNPLVTVQVTRAAVPSFFSRIWGNQSQSVSASATAEAFNPSGTGTGGNQTTGGTIVPVKPWCVKPWVVANRDPLNPPPGGGGGGFCTGAGCLPFVDPANGQIRHPGISLEGTSTNGVIGETFSLSADCRLNSAGCVLRGPGPGLQPQANFTGSGNVSPRPNLLYVPNLVTTSVAAVPNCTTGDPYNEAIVGCDQPTNYSCGVQDANTVDLTLNPANATTDGVQCLTNQANNNDLSQSSGQDYLKFDLQFGNPSVYPFQILAGSGNPLVSTGLPAGTPISSSASIVSLPIYDDTLVTLQSNTQRSVTFVGFLQVFINSVDNKGNVNVTVLNVAGCSNGNGVTVGSAVGGTSPVPIRLVTPP